MNAYEMYSADKSKETGGIWLDFGSFRIKVARAGGSNVAFAKCVEEKTRPYRRAIDQGVMDPKRGDELLAEVFAEVIVLDWQVKKDDGELVQGMHTPEGDIAPFTRDNVKNVFIDLPELFQQVQNETAKLANFRKEAVKAEGKN